MVTTAWLSCLNYVVDLVRRISFYNMIIHHYLIFTDQPINISLSHSWNSCNGQWIKLFFYLTYTYNRDIYWKYSDCYWKERENIWERMVAMHKSILPSSNPMLLYIHQKITRIAALYMDRYIHIYIYTTCLYICVFMLLCGFLVGSWSWLTEDNRDFLTRSPKGS